MFNDSQSLPEWVDSRTGAQLLGVKSKKFFYHVERGEIGVEPSRGPKDNRYKVADILAVKKRLTGRRKKLEPTLIDWLQPSDIPAGLRLDQQLYPDEIDLAEAAVYQSWRRNNNKLTMAAFTKDRSECLAYIQLVPLTESLILNILSGKRPENSIKPEEVEAYGRPGGYTLLAVSAVAHPSRPDLLYKILYKMAEYWIEQYPERYITRIYAQAVSRTGDMLIQHFFMAPRYDLAPDAYMLDMARPGASKMIRWFQSQLKQKAPLPEELQHPYTLPQQ
jgi:hypothetical protein